MVTPTMYEYHCILKQKNGGLFTYEDNRVGRISYYVKNFYGKMYRSTDGWMDVW